MKGELPVASPKVMAEILDSLTPHPTKKRLVLFLSIIIPGLGAAICGQKKGGALIFLIMVSSVVLAFLLSPSFLHSNSIFVLLLHTLAVIGAVTVWVVNIVFSLMSYEVNIEILKSKFRMPDHVNFSKIHDKMTHFTDILFKDGKWHGSGNLDEMLNNPRHAIITMSLIVSMTFIATKVNAFLDKVWISGISTDATSAVTTVSSIYSVVAAIGVGIGTGACVCVAYSLGKKSFGRSQELATASIFLSLLVSIPTAIFMITAVGPITSVQGEEISRLSMDYILPLALGCPFIILSGVIGSLFKAEGAMKVMTMCALVSIPVNAVLTPFFINSLHWGITGASLATVLGSVVSTVLSYYMFRRGKYHFKLKLSIPSSASLREILSVGGPKAFEEAMGGLIILFQTLIISINTGNLALAVVSIGFSFPYLMTMIPDSITAGATPVCSAQAGAHNIDVMKKSIRTSMMFILWLSVAAAIVLLIFADPINAIFIGNKEVDDKELLLNATRMYAMMMPFYLLGRASSNMLQVVRKSQISAPVYIGLGFLRLGVLFIFGTGIIEVVWVEVIMNSLVGIVMLALLGYYTKRFDPDKVDANENRRFNQMEIVRRILGNEEKRDERSA